MPETTFACPDLTTFLGLDALGLTAVGQLLTSTRAIVECHMPIGFSEFADRLRIHKIKGTRYYKDEDIETIKNIQYLLRKAGCTIEGAKAKLANDTHRVAARRDVSERLRAVRDELLAIRREINTTSFTDDVIID